MSSWDEHKKHYAYMNRNNITERTLADETLSWKITHKLKADESRQEEVDDGRWLRIHWRIHVRIQGFHMVDTFMRLSVSLSLHFSLPSFSTLPLSKSISYESWMWLQLSLRFECLFLRWWIDVIIGVGIWRRVLKSGLAFGRDQWVAHDWRKPPADSPAAAWRLKKGRKGKECTVSRKSTKSTHSIHRHTSPSHELWSEWANERANEWVQRSARAKRAVRSSGEQANELAVRANERMTH